MNKKYNEIDTEWMANQLYKRGTNGRLDLECWIVNYAKRLDEATNGKAQALLTITDHLGWTQEDDKDVDVVALIKERTPDPIPYQVLKQERKKATDTTIKMNMWLDELSKKTRYGTRYS